jgi:hypothetical protein
MYLFSEKVVKIIRQPNVSYITLIRNNTAQPIYQTINETAASIFELINKNYTFNRIVKELSKKYNENEGAVSKKISINYFHITTVEDNINAIKGRITPNCGCGSLTLAIDSSLNVLPCVMIRNRP